MHLQEQSFGVSLDQAGHLFLLRCWRAMSRVPHARTVRAGATTARIKSPEIDLDQEEPI